MCDEDFAPHIGAKSEQFRNSSGENRHKNIHSRNISRIEMLLGVKYAQNGSVTKVDCELDNSFDISLIPLIQYYNNIKLDVDKKRAIEYIRSLAEIDVSPR